MTKEWKCLYCGATKLSKNKVKIKICLACQEQMEIVDEKWEDDEYDRDI